jgi:hypothetical protein
VVGGCAAGIALFAGAVLFVMARSRGGDQTEAFPAAVEVELCDGVEGQEDAISFVNPLENVDIFASTT